MSSMCIGYAAKAFYGYTTLPKTINGNAGDGCEYRGVYYRCMGGNDWVMDYRPDSRDSWESRERIEMLAIEAVESMSTGEQWKFIEDMGKSQP